MSKEFSGIRVTASFHRWAWAMHAISKLGWRGTWVYRLLLRRAVKSLGQVSQ